MEKEIFDGRWELVGTRNKKYLLINIYNGNELIITHEQLCNLRNGKDSVSRIITRRIDCRTPYVTNYVQKNYKEQKQHYIR